VRASEQQARSRMAELEAIYATAPVGLCIIDRDLRFVRINDRMAEINGHPAADHIGRHVRDMVPDLTEQAETLLHRVLESGEPALNIEIVGETPAQPGVTRTWLEHWTPVRDDTGEIIGVNVVAEEVTERKRREELLRRSEAMARSTAEKRQILLHEVNHRVKNSLALVASLLNLQARGTSPEVAAALNEACHRIQAVAEVHRGFYLGEDVDQVDLTDLLKEMIEQVAPLRPEISVSLTVEDHLQLSADQAVPVGLIVNELLTNALKHAFPDGANGRVDVRVRSCHGHMVVSVSDTGRGMSADWSPQFGTSLGGRLLQGLAAQVQADLSYSSSPGHGTTFHLTVPDRRHADP